MRSRLLAAGLAAVLCAAAPLARAILPIQHWQTANGARVYFVESRGLPVLDVSVEFPAGAGYDSPGKFGVAAMTNHLLTAGVDGMSEDDIARRKADIGAQMSGRFDADRAGLQLRTLSSDQERRPALELFTRILRDPTFPRDALDREKVLWIASIKESDTRPGTVVSRAFYQLAYRDHPYARRSTGEVESVEKIARGDLVEFYRRHYVSQQAVVALIGDVTRAQAEAIAEQVTRGLPSASAQPPQLPPVSALPEGVTRRIDHHATQAHILIGAPGMRRDDPDYFPLLVGNHVLGGGGFVSRMTEEVRQKRGLAYSASSYLSPMQREGPFIISMQTQRSQAAEALEVARATLREFVAGGPGEQELAAAKQNIVGGFPMRIDSNRKILENLAMIGYYRLPLTYLEDFTGNVERVTVADVKDAFARRIRPERMVTVVVGADEAKP